MTRRTKVILAVAAGTPLALWLAVSCVGVFLIVMPRHAQFPDRETIDGHAVVPVSIPTSDGLTVSAWCVPQDPDKAVILLAGITGDRRACIGHAECYLELGYTVLLPDLRGTGKSGGSLVTLGWHERKDLAACYDYLREVGYRHVGADGISLGAATICYALSEVDDFAFIVIESSYDTLKTAFNNRVTMFGGPSWFAAPARALFKLFAIGAGAGPIDFMAQCTAPALILSGDAEGVIKVSETRALFERCGSSLKRMYLFKGGGHTNFARRYADDYRRELEAFLDEAAAAWDDGEAK